MTSDASSEIPLTDPIEARIATEVAKDGETKVARRAAHVLDGGYEGEEFLLVLGGEHASGIINGAPALYWPELWGARALLYVWDASAAENVLEGLKNASWRVREMCLRVAAARGLGDLRAFTRLSTDRHARVRAAAARALATVTTGPEDDVTAVLTRMLRDPDKDVRRAAQQAIVAVREE